VRRLLPLVLLLAALIAPATAAQACDILQVETLEAELPAAPGALQAGRALTLPVRVTRGGQPAGEVNVFVALRGSGFSAYKSAVTDAAGKVTLPIAVPASARGAAELDLEVYRTLVDLPCAEIEEYDRRTEAWGRVR
jgi:hypothetical protein